MTRITTHVLDTAEGEPASGIAVTLLEPSPEPAGSWRALARQQTDDDGRIASFPDTGPGRYRLVFEPAGRFFAEVIVTFEVPQGREHLHVPLLISPFGLSVYRGS